VSHVHDKLAKLTSDLQKDSSAPVADAFPSLHLVPSTPLRSGRKIDFFLQALQKRTLRNAMVLAMIAILGVIAIVATRNIAARGSVLQQAADVANATSKINSLIQIGKFTEAVDSIQAILKNEPLNVNAMIELAFVHKSASHVDLAEKVLQEVLKINVSEPTALNNLGSLYASQKRWPEAIDAFKKALLARKDYSEASMNLAAAYEATNEWSESVSQYENFLSIDHEFMTYHADIQKRLRLLRAFQTYSENQSGIQADDHKEQD
jgi:tetratricopeptide (TPR) repeat protein